MCWREDVVLVGGVSGVVSSGVLLPSPQKSHKLKNIKDIFFHLLVDLEMDKYLLYLNVGVQNTIYYYLNI